jgi:hypothetical protein
MTSPSSSNSESNAAGQAPGSAHGTHTPVPAAPLNSEVPGGFEETFRRAFEEEERCKEKPREEATPRTDAAITYDRFYEPVQPWVKADFARQLERELADSRSGMDEANKRWIEAREIANRETLNAAYWKDRAENMQRCYAEACVRVVGMGITSFGTLNEGLDKLKAARSATPAMSFTHAQAVCILKVRDALLVKDVQEAYHWLYTLDSKQVPHDPFKPWADLERLAAAPSPDGNHE